MIFVIDSRVKVRFLGDMLGSLRKRVFSSGMLNLGVGLMKERNRKFLLRTESALDTFTLFM